MPKSNIKKIVPRKVSKTTKANPSKMKRLSLKPPSPSKFNHIDTVSRLNIEVSAAGYALGWASKGPPSSTGKPFTLPLEQKVCDTSDLRLNEHLNCYGLANRKAKGSSNEPMQFGWNTSNGDKKWSNWKVSMNMNNTNCALI